MTVEFENQNYWAIILGGSSGLGLASAKKLAQQGMNICIVHRNSRSEMKRISESLIEIEGLGIELLSFNVDAMNTDKMEMVLTQLKEKMGAAKVRCLLHSIAKGNLKPMLDPHQMELKKEDLMMTYHNMAVSLYEWTKAVYAKNLFARDSRVLSFTSEGNQKPMKGYGAVSVAKVALEAITRNIALEFASEGIRANCIQAGITNTASQRKIPGSEEMRAYAVRRNPFGRITKAEDVANVIYLLCKDEAAWINGAIIPVDGGESLL